MNTNASYYIGDIAKDLGLSQRTVRYYEELGLVKPTRTDGGFRTYSKDDVEILKLICTFKDLGVALEDIRDMLLPAKDAGMKEVIAHLKETLSKKKFEFESKKKKYEEGVRQIDKLLCVLSGCASCGKENDAVICEECMKRQNKDVPPLIHPLLNRKSD